MKNGIYPAGPAFIAARVKRLLQAAVRRGFFVLAILTTSCATAPNIQPQINSLVSGQRYDYALRVLENNEEAYGENERLLYLMDLGLLLHQAGRYGESIRYFERAKDLYEELYTRSITRQASTWIVNDNLVPYRGEDFERVMINMFQALNFVQLGRLESALVEARNVNRTLGLINQRYEDDQKNVYQRDGFARLLSGVIYQAAGGYQNLNSAFIDYKLAYDAYRDDYRVEYDMSVPDLLKRHLLAVSERYDPQAFRAYLREFGNIHYLSLEERENMAHVYLIHYRGFSPIKRQAMLILPVKGQLVKYAFPRYDKRPTLGALQDFEVSSSRESKRARPELVQDIGAIAVKQLERRKMRLIAKTGVRGTAKAVAAYQAGQYVESEHGRTAGYAANIAGQAYTILSEQADVRSWQTLPGTIYMAHIAVPPGVVDVSYGSTHLERVHLEAGETRFFIHR